MPRIVCVGTRSPHRLPREWVELFVAAVRQFAREGAVIHSTATPGSDRLAVENALRVGGSVRIYLPWSAYEQSWVDKMLVTYPQQVETDLYEEGAHPDWVEAVHAWHPTARYLAPAMMAMYARTFGSVLEADHVLALPMPRKVKGDVEKGSSEQAIWLALRQEIPLWDLSEEPSRSRLQRRLKNLAPNA